MKNEEWRMIIASLRSALMFFWFVLVFSFSSLYYPELPAGEGGLNRELSQYCPARFLKSYSIHITKLNTLLWCFGKSRHKVLLIWTMYYWNDRCFQSFSGSHSRNTQNVWFGVSGMKSPYSLKASIIPKISLFSQNSWSRNFPKPD